MDDVNEEDKMFTGRTLPLGQSDDEASLIGEGDEGRQDVSGHQSIMSDDDTGGYPDSLRSSASGTEAIRQKKDDGGELATIKRDNETLLILKLVIISVLALISVGLSVTVFVYVDSQEHDDYVTNYEDDTYRIFADLGMALYLRFAELDSLAVTLAAYAASSSTNMTFQGPPVTLPDFAVRVAKVRSMSHAVAFEQYHFVNEDDREEWEEYARGHSNEWIQQALEVQMADDSYHGIKPSLETILANDTDLSAMDGIQYGSQLLPPNSGPYIPSWQAYPIVPNVAYNTGKGIRTLYNWNAAMDPFLGPGIQHAVTTKKAVLTQVVNMIKKEDLASNQESAQASIEWASRLISSDADPSEPMVRFLYPVMDTANTQAQSTNSISNSSKVLGLLSSSFYWSTLLADILPSGQHGLLIVIANSCGQTFTYVMDGHNATYLGQGDQHSYAYSDRNLTANITALGEFDSGNAFYSGLPVSSDYCLYNITTYPTEAYEDEYRSNDPHIFTYSVILIFVFTAVCFLGYDQLVSDRQNKVMKSAQKSNAIVSSLFPSTVRDRLYDGAGDNGHLASMFQPNKARLKSFLHDGTHGGNVPSNGNPGSMGFGGSKPIADLFTDCTVMFADIANFTAWSSVREPGQVFTLLETIYGAFDHIAARRGVFKVETIGDSYVAVTGLPEPRHDHAVVMVRFARDCRQQCLELSRRLETTLGPDTAELRMRFGLNSGPVTAGVLRGEKSRFQLFGDTVNTAARMESTGSINKIHVSQTTADLLIKASKSNWVKSRKDKIEAKGKGYMQTYWVEPGSRNAQLSEEFALSETRPAPADLDCKTERLVDWNVAVLCRMITQIIAYRNSHQQRKPPISNGKRQVSPSVNWNMPQDAIVLHEFKEIIELPDFNAALQEQDPRSVELALCVQEQVRDYVSAIALTYHDNPFHNFEHASHVCMSVAKLLSRIVAPDQVYDKDNGDTRVLASNLHDHTYGITSDPLTQFACVFAALIHDADHPGVPNPQLVKEETETARRYQGKSVAEQNSVNVAWNILEQEKYADLRGAICETQEEEVRFRQLVVNTVMATDIMDGDLKKLREERWKKAFYGRQMSQNKTIGDPYPGEDQENHDYSAERVSVNRKATIVIEHLIQASDVAHTMQHWHIYRKWNERLFAEMHQAFSQGRADRDPAEFWYQGEMGFFDFYIIPLAKKLSECGVFGVSSDEYLNYALQNRNEWEKKGLSVVKEMLEKLGGQNAVSTVGSKDEL